MKEKISTYNHTIKFFLAFFLLISSNLELKAQSIDNKIDSLINLSKEDTIAAKRIIFLSEALDLAHNNAKYSKEIESLKLLISMYNGLELKYQEFSYLLKLLYLYEDKSDQENMASVYFDIGELLFDFELYLKSESYYLELETLFIKISNTELKQQTQQKLGDISSILGESSKSILWYKKSLQQAKRLYDEKLINHLYQSIGVEYQKINKYDDGIEYYNNLLGQYSIDNSNGIRGILLNNLGVLYSKKGLLEDAEKNFVKSLNYLEENKENAEVITKAYINLAIIQQKMANTEEALTSLSHADYLCKLYHLEELEIQVYYITSNMYFYVVDYHNALFYIDKAIESGMIAQYDEMTADAILFKSNIYKAIGNHELARDFKSSFLEEESIIQNNKIVHEATINSRRINIERIEKDALVYQKKSAEEVAKYERINAELESQKSRESQILRDQALALAQHERDKNRIFEIEKDAALNRAKRDSLTAVNALAQEEIAKQKSISDSVKTVFALQKQRIAQKEANSAKDVINRSRLIGILLFVILMIIIGGLFYQRRLNSELSEEKEKSDRLLLNILPTRVADELKHNSKVSPKKYEYVSVLFTDFVDFTKIAEKIGEHQLIEELDRFFNVFDSIIEKHNLEKIKTIGDSYMCAGGVPQENSTNAYDAVMAGLEIAEFIKKDRAQKKKEGIETWDIRIGINTGPVIAGVVGSKKFAYDIWGDTVNIASRIESSGLNGYVNISESTYIEVKESFECVSRGMIIAKNIGAVPMFYVKSKLG